MEFASQSQQACYEKIRPWVKDLFGEFARLRDDKPCFGIFMGSAFTEIAVFPWGEDDATICTRSYLVSGADITPELTRWLLGENANMRFGAFGIDTDNDILFEHTIVGATCDKEELKASVMAVLWTADKYDDEIVAKWGGQRAADRFK